MSSCWESSMRFLLNNFLLFNRTRRSNTVFTRARNYSLFSARSIQPVPLHSPSLCFISVLSYHLRLGALAVSFHLAFPPIKCMYSSSPPPLHPYGHSLGFLDRSRYFFFRVAPQLYSEAEWTPFQTTTQKIW
jgi:hypothetical protein